MSVEKTYAEINTKIKSGKAVVVTAEELIALVEEKGLSQAAQDVDVVTTGTFAPMCSSGVFLSFWAHNTTDENAESLAERGIRLCRPSSC